MARLFAAPVLALALLACGNAGHNAQCIASPESEAAISERLAVQGGEFLHHAFAVALPPSSDFDFVVAAEIDGAGFIGEGDIGLWAVDDLRDGPFYAANSVAKISQTGTPRQRTDYLSTSAASRARSRHTARRFVWRPATVSEALSEVGCRSVAA